MTSGEERVMLEKPCVRPGCTTPVRHRFRHKLNQRRYCSSTCASQHRLEVEGANHPLKRRTPEQRHQNAVAGARSRVAQQRKARLIAIGAIVDRFLPRDWLRRFDMGPEEIARIKALMVRSYQSGHAAGYSAGHTKQRREKAA